MKILKLLSDTSLTPLRLLLELADDTNGLIGKNGKIEGDLYTERNNWEIVEGKLEHSLVPASWGMTHYVRLLTEGKTWTQICTFMNENQWWDEGKPPRTNQNYKHHPN